MKYLILLMFLFSSFNIYAQQNLEIVAKVNNKVITSIDVKNRISLLTAGDEEAKKQKNITQALASQVLADLIREYLQLEYAHENNIKVTDAELDAAFKSIAQKNGLGVKGFEEFLAKNKVSRKSLDEKLEAQIAWNKLVGSKFGKTIQVTADEVNKEYTSINSQIEKAKKTPVEVFLSEILIGTKNRSKADANNLAKQIIKDYNNGTQFSELAFKYSDSKSKENGGTLGWVSIGQMKDSIRKKIEAAKPQSILPPFEDNKNIVLLKVGNKRDLSNGKGATQKEPKITKEQASNVVFSRKLEEEGQRFTNKIYKEAYIEILEGNLKNIR